MFTAKFFDYEAGKHKLIDFKSMRAVLNRADKESIASITVIQDWKEKHDCRRDTKGEWFIYKTAEIKKGDKI